MWVPSHRTCSTSRRKQTECPPGIATLSPGGCPAERGTRKLLGTQCHGTRILRPGGDVRRRLGGALSRPPRLLAGGGAPEAAAAMRQRLSILREHLEAQRTGLEEHLGALDARAADAVQRTSEQRRPGIELPGVKWCTRLAVPGHSEGSHEETHTWYASCSGGDRCPSDTRAVPHATRCPCATTGRLISEGMLCPARASAGR